MVAISTTIMERGIHSPKQLNTATTWRRHGLGTVLSPIPMGVRTPQRHPQAQLTVGAELLQQRVFILMGQLVLR